MIAFGEGHEADERREASRRISSRKPLATASFAAIIE
jgi:hypothetical protein